MPKRTWLLAGWLVVASALATAWAQPTPPPAPVVPPAPEVPALPRRRLPRRAFRPRPQPNRRRPRPRWFPLRHPPRGDGKRRRVLGSGRAGLRVRPAAAEQKCIAPYTHGDAKTEEGKIDVAPEQEHADGHDDRRSGGQRLPRGSLRGDADVPADPGIRGQLLRRVGSADDPHARQQARRLRAEQAQGVGVRPSGQPDGDTGRFLEPDPERQPPRPLRGRLVRRLQSGRRLPEHRTSTVDHQRADPSGRLYHRRQLLPDGDRRGLPRRALDGDLLAPSPQGSTPGNGNMTRSPARRRTGMGSRPCSRRRPSTLPPSSARRPGRKYASAWRRKSRRRSSPPSLRTRRSTIRPSTHPSTGHSLWRAERRRIDRSIDRSGSHATHKRHRRRSVERRRWRWKFPARGRESDSLDPRLDRL